MQHRRIGIHSIMWLTQTELGHRSQVGCRCNCTVCLCIQAWHVLSSNDPKIYEEIRFNESEQNAAHKNSAGAAAAAAAAAAVSGAGERCTYSTLLFFQVLGCIAKWWHIVLLLNLCVATVIVRMLLVWITQLYLPNEGSLAEAWKACNLNQN